jgi:preprotein translocase subunit SecD
MRFCLSTMRVYWSRFNLFLALAVLLTPLCGCTSLFHKNQPVGAMRIHIELAPENAAAQTGEAETVSLLRANPVQVTIDKTPILTEANLLAAKVIATPDAPAIEVRFDENGTWILEQYTASNPGRHLVIYGQWGKKLKEGRWLAAPLITGRLNYGILSFTPDMTRDEANKFVLGLNSVAKQFQTTGSE